MAKEDLVVSSDDGSINGFGNTSDQVNVALQRLLHTPELAEALSGRTGGAFVLLDSNTGALIGQCIAGTLHAGDVPKYMRFAYEKALRLYYMHKHVGHTSSAQSADDDNGEFPGAIWTPSRILSFSGLPGKADWAICLSTGVSCGMHGLGDAWEIAERDGDEYFKYLAETCC